jgi:hypothetical protein
LATFSMGLGYNKHMQSIYIPTNDIVTPRGACAIILRDGITGKIKAVDYIKNTFCTVGKNAIADALRGNEASSRGIITYCAVGTNITAPTAADTTLGTELFRKPVSVRSASGNVATFQTFFTTSEANGTLREAGLFGDGASETTDSGTLFSKLAINRTKTSGDTLTLNWDITIG